MGDRSKVAGAVLSIAIGIGDLSGAAQAYTAAGDRNFVATLLLPQLSPTDEFYVTPTTVPGRDSRQTNVNATYSKMLTERLGLAFTASYGWFDPKVGPAYDGPQNVSVNPQFLLLLDQEHELVVSLSAEHEFGSTGQRRAGANRVGGTTPALLIGKGFGDLDIGYLRPFAVTAMLGMEVADHLPRRNQYVTGFTLQYSLPYLESKVQAFDLPPLLAGLTPIVEMRIKTPVHDREDTTRTGTVAPGFNYASEGWDIGFEALVPINRASGKGLGFGFQLHLSLDYLFPNSIGRPLFLPR